MAGLIGLEPDTSKIWKKNSSKNSNYKSANGKFMKIVKLLTLTYLHTTHVSAK
jgi:hypothetical protein